MLPRNTSSTSTDISPSTTHKRSLPFSNLLYESEEQNSLISTLQSVSACLRSLTNHEVALYCLPQGVLPQEVRTECETKPRGEQYSANVTAKRFPIYSIFGGFSYILTVCVHRLKIISIEAKRRARIANNKPSLVARLLPEKADQRQVWLPSLTPAA